MDFREDAAKADRLVSIVSLHDQGRHLAHHRRSWLEQGWPLQSRIASAATSGIMPEDHDRNALLCT